MCLFTTWRLPRLSIKTKITYKIVKKVSEKEYSSNIFNYRYKENEGNRAPLFPIFSHSLDRSTGFRYVDRGYFHSYMVEEDLVQDLKSRLPCMPEEVVVKCMVPRFTIYYEGEFNEICSKRIIVVGKI